jgi:predicted secreted protein
MATMVNGTNMVLSIDDTTNTADGTTPVLTAIAAATSCTLTLTVDAPEVTDKSSLDKKEYCGLSRTWSVDAEVFYNEDGAVDFATMALPAMGISVAAGTVSPIIADYPRRVFVKFLGTTGGNNYSGYGYITSLSATGGTEDGATYSVSITGTGALSYAAS